MAHTYAGDMIRKYRKEKEWTQKQLGEACGIHEANIRKYELGKQNPKKETLEKIADALGVSFFSFYEHPYDTPELFHIFHEDELGLLKFLLNESVIPCSEKEKEIFLNNIDKDIEAGKNIPPNEVDTYFNELSVKYSHQIIEHILSIYKDDDAIFYAYPIRFDSVPLEQKIDDNDESKMLLSGAHITLEYNRHTAFDNPFYFVLDKNESYESFIERIIQFL